MSYISKSVAAIGSVYKYIYLPSFAAALYYHFRYPRTRLQTKHNQMLSPLHTDRNPNPILKMTPPTFHYPNTTFIHNLPTLHAHLLAAKAELAQSRFARSLARKDQLECAIKQWKSSLENAQKYMDEVWKDMPGGRLLERRTAGDVVLWQGIIAACFAVLSTFVAVWLVTHRF